MQDTDYPWRTSPMNHQREIWSRSRRLPGFQIACEQGTGKAKIGVDTAAALYLEGEIRRVLVVAPNEVHVNWITDEVPAHMPREADALGFVYRSSKAKTKRSQEGLAELAKHRGLQMLTMSYDAIRTRDGYALAERYAKNAPTLVILDESQRIKNIHAEQSKACRRLGKLAKYRRTMTGTPMVKDPLDVYNQIAFTDPEFWPSKGFSTFTAFKNEFAVMGYRPWSRFPVITGFRQLDYLRELLLEVSARVLKEDVLDLPPKVYERIGFDLSPAQRRAYDQLVNEYRVELDSGLVVDAAMAVTRMTRLQQITCNYLPTETGSDTYEQISDDNPRLDLLIDRLEDTPHQAIVWHRFREDGRLIAEACKAAKLTCARFDGTVNEDDRQRAKAAFKAGDVQFLVANPATISTGITLNEAKTHSYYSLSTNFEHRLQSEDRSHRFGQKDSVLYLDYVGRGTVDEKLVANLVSKNEMAMVVNGDTWRQWIS